MGYLKINNLYKDNSIMAFRECYALEKVHGTSAHIQWSKGKVTFFSGGEKHENFVSLFSESAVTELFKSLEYPDDIVVRIHGEAYGGKQQGMKDTYGPNLHFIAFDVRIGDNWLDVPKAENYCSKFGIEFVPYEKIETSIEALNHERDRDSIVAIRRGMGDGHKREGVVLRPLFEVKLNDGSRLISKHKRDEFRETKTPRNIDAEKQKMLEEAESIADEWCVPMRLHHVLDKMKMDGKDPGIEKTRDVIFAMIDDIYAESSGEIVRSKEAERAIGSKTASLFKKYLKDKLTET